jgi:hypothetical protein
LIRRWREEEVTSYGSSVLVGKSTGHIGVKLLKLQPYKTTVIHSLSPPGSREEFDTAGGFRNWYSVDFLTQKRHGYINSQNNRY